MKKFYKKIREQTVWTPVTKAVKLKPPADQVPWDELQEGGSIDLGPTFSEDDLLEPGARPVTLAEVCNSVGAEREAWKTAGEAEVQNSFYNMGAVSETTPAELAKVGGQSGVLPMTAVWSMKPGGVHKNRGCVCVWKFSNQESH